MTLDVQSHPPRQAPKSATSLTKKRLWFFKTLLGLDTWSLSLITGWSEGSIRKRITQWKLREESAITRATQDWIDREGGAARFGVTGEERNSDGVLQDLHVRVSKTLQSRFQPDVAVDWTIIDEASVPETLARELEDGGNSVVRSS